MVRKPTSLELWVNDVDTAFESSGSPRTFVRISPCQLRACQVASHGIGSSGDSFESGHRARFLRGPRESPSDPPEPGRLLRTGVGFSPELMSNGADPKLAGGI